MVSHSSSASLSSFHFSYASSSPSCSSLSSPPSSPDSSHNSFAPPASPCPPSSTPALVPFLWEERPGVLKKAMQIGEGGGGGGGGGHGHRNHRDASPSDHGRPPRPGNVHPRTARTANSCALSSKQMSKTFLVSSSKSKSGSESVPHLRPPPCLSQPNLHVYVQGNDGGADNNHHHRRWRASVGAKPKALSSFPFQKMRHHHRATSLEDDPFWMAMMACTNDEDEGSRMQSKGNRDKAYEVEMQGTNSWFARRVQGHSIIDFDQCMPRHASNRGSKSHTSSCVRNSNSEAVRDAHASKGDRHDCTDASEHATHLGSKALKALNIAKSELQDRCKVLLQQQGGPVDLSCATRYAKKSSSPSKHKHLDLFGRKSHRPLSSILP